MIRINTKGNLTRRTIGPRLRWQCRLKEKPIAAEEKAMSDAVLKESIVSCGHSIAVLCS